METKYIMKQTTLILFIADFIPAVFYMLYFEMVDSHKTV